MNCNTTHYRANSSSVPGDPTYPQYSSAATGSSAEEILRLAAPRWVTPAIQVVGDFYDHPGFIAAFAAAGAPVLARLRPDHVLFSFHGLPERHMRKADPTGQHCFSSERCCDAVGPANRWCYRAQSFATARALAAKLGLADGTWTVGFQSRLGRDPWIKPYTDHLLTELAQRGVKRLAVYSPSFVADCLETLEEIGIRGKEQFLAAGGEALELVPSLNSSPEWVETIRQIVGE